MAVAAARTRSATGDSSLGDAHDGAKLRRLVREEGLAVLDVAGSDCSDCSDGAELADVRGNRIRVEPVDDDARSGGSS